MLQKLGVSRSAFNNVINDSASLSLEMVLRLETIGSGSAEMWAKMQSDYTLGQLRIKANQLRKMRH